MARAYMGCCACRRLMALATAASAMRAAIQALSQVGLYSPHSTHSSCAAVCSITHFTAAKHACHGGASGGGTGYICSSNPHSMPSAALFRLTRVDQRGYGLDDVRLGGVSLRMPLQDDHVRLLDVLDHASVCGNLFSALHVIRSYSCLAT